MFVALVVVILLWWMMRAAYVPMHLQHAFLRQEDTMTDLLAHLKSADRVVRLTAIRAFLRLVRPKQTLVCARCMHA